MKRQYGTIIDNPEASHARLVVGVPMTGVIRSEWAMARYGQVAPPNWSHKEYSVWLDQYSPIRFSVADARNLIVKAAIETGVDWLFFIDSDVLLPPGTLIRLNQYMMKADYPIVNGLYFTRGYPSEPLVYRGLGNGHYADWKIGDKIWVDGAGMGCTLIHTSILKALWEESEPCVIRGAQARQVFRTPAGQAYDPQTKIVSTVTGTEDLDFYHRLQKNGIYKKAGWPKFQKKKYPLLVDTGIFCRHIDINGTQYPSQGEEQEFLRKG